MVCPRCITAVKQTLTKLNINYLEVKLGEAIISNQILDYTLLNKELKSIGFELIQDKNKIITERVKTLIIDVIHHTEKELNFVFSDFIKDKIQLDYSYISTVFSETEGLTIEKFIIIQKIEKVKELINYNELNFSEIAYKLNYNSAAYLSKQFKDITGNTLSEYKKNNQKKRKTLDNIS